MTLEASRVTLARQRAGLSKSALAHKAGTTPRTVTTWESVGPPSSRLHQIATITGMPPEFFSTKEIDILEEKQVFFRARRRSPSALLRRSTAFGALGVEFYRSVSKHFRTPALSLIDTEFRNSPQEAAMALRLAWGMGLGPAPNLVQMAEAHGIRVLGIPLEDVKVDAFSFWSAEGRPFIFLSRVKTAERSRFDLAHEIGHLVLHSDVTRTEESTDRQIEHEANIFAASHRGLACQAVKSSVTRYSDEDQEHLRNVGHRNGAFDLRRRSAVGLGIPSDARCAHHTRLPSRRARQYAPLREITSLQHSQ